MNQPPRLRGAENKWGFRKQMRWAGIAGFSLKDCRGASCSFRSGLGAVLFINCWWLLFALRDKCGAESGWQRRCRHSCPSRRIAPDFFYFFFMARFPDRWVFCAACKQPPRPSSNCRQRRLSLRFAAWKRCAGYKGRFQICRVGQRRPAP